MRRLFWLTLLIAVAGLSAQAQAPRVEVFGGYSWARFDQGYIPSVLPGNEVASGWGASLSWNSNRLFGFTADFAGQFGDGRRIIQTQPCIGVFPPPPGCVENVNFSAYQFLFGPRVAVRAAGATLFAHGLLGAAHTRVSTPGGETSETDLAVAFGGGLDVGVFGPLGLRVVQVDYIPVHRGGIFQQDWQQNLRLQTGVVLRF